MAVQEEELTEATDRMNFALAVSDKAVEMANKAAAEVARLTLLKLADEDDDLIGMNFEVNSEYDDEGSYFKTVSVFPEYVLKECVDHDFSDEMNAFGQWPLCILCGVHGDSWEGAITIAEARERRF